MDETTFCGLPLLIPSGRVMRPRLASEQLVATALAFLRGGPGKVVDVGTGSGAVAIAIANAAPGAEVWATDTSPEAVLAARGNVAAYGLEDRVKVRLGDLLDPVPGTIDLVVANLPCLPASDAWRFPDLAEEPARSRVRRGRRTRSVPAAPRHLCSAATRRRSGRDPAPPARSDRLSRATGRSAPGDRGRPGARPPSRTR